MNGSRTRRRFVYSIDRFNILFGLTIPEIRRVINYTQLKTNLSRYARSLNLIPVSQEARMRGYHSQLVVVLPTRELLEELSRSIANNRHVVVSMEIACDRLYQRRPETIIKKREMMKVLRKKWSPAVRIYDAAESSVRRTRRTSDLEYEHELYGSETLYTGAASFEFTVYTRLSKMTREPCVHCEWKINKSLTTRKRTGVRTIHDLAVLDVERTFLNLYHKYIKYEDINHETHGRFIQNMPTSVPTPGWVRAGQRVGAKKLPFDRASKHYLRINDITTSAQLRTHYVNNKRELQRANRELTAVDNRILNLSTNKLNTFFISLPDQFFENS